MAMNERENVINTLKAYFEEKEEYAFVLLFGSFANGKVHEMSDVDIGLYTEDDPDYMQLGYMQVELERLLDRKADIVLLNPMVKKDPFMAFEILSDHDVLACKDESEYIAFKTGVQLHYLDQQPLAKINLEALQRRVHSSKTIGKRNYAVTH